MKKLLTIFTLIMLIISFFQITSMFALYKEKIQGEYNTLLGSWNIKVNATDITYRGQVETFTIANDQLGYVTSDYIQAGKIAPEGQAYFDIVIDPTDTDVSIIYTIDIDEKAISSTNTEIELIDAIELVKVDNYFGQGTDGNTNKTLNDLSYKDGNLYTSVIPLEKITEGYKNYVRVYFEWKNVIQTVTETVIENEEEKEVEKQVEVNNEQDTVLAETQNSKLSIPLKINLKQYTGEVIGNGS